VLDVDVVLLVDVMIKPAAGVHAHGPFVQAPPSIHAGAAVVQGGGAAAASACRSARIRACA
jgi:hypothetical protein